jgi:hypothetical protein
MGSLNVWRTPKIGRRDTWLPRLRISAALSRKEVHLVLYLAALAAGAMLSAVLALALWREARLRRALETLLRRILTAWRRGNAQHDADDRRHSGGPDDPGDRM